MPALVHVHDLYKRYGRVDALDGVSFGLGAGEIFGLLGPNGAGKTTALECLAGLRRPDRGEISVAGFDVRHDSRLAREKMGVVLQATSLPDQLKVREALQLFGAFYRERVPAATLLDQFGLGGQAASRYGELSGGQRQRLALALALVNRPAVIILDEPTAALDPQARRDLHAAIRQLRRDGCAVLLSTHDLEEAQVLCDRLAILDRGRIVATGTPDELINGFGGKQTVTLTVRGVADAAGLARLPGVESVEGTGPTLRLQTADATRLLPVLSAWLETQQLGLEELHVGRASLADVFLRLTEKVETRQ